MTTAPENRWPTDGHDHHYIERSNIYENAKIRSFLDGTNVSDQLTPSYLSELISLKLVST
jgi:hypothetical protein